MQEIGAEPTISELKRALNCLSSRKAPGKDGIPPEIVKLCIRIPSNRTPCDPLSLLAGGSSPIGHARLKYRHPIQDQGRRERLPCSNYRGISILKIVSKLLAHVALKRVQVIADRVYPESQCGFRANRST